MNWAEACWIGVGLAGQLCFSARMLYQWLVSEKRGESVVPTAFWYLSLGGGLCLLTYAVYRQDPVFILGQSTGVCIYARNLVLIHRPRVPSRKQEVDYRTPSGEIPSRLHPAAPVQH